MYEHNALGYWSGLALCLTKVRSSRARCPATALIAFTVMHVIKVMLMKVSQTVSIKEWKFTGKCFCVRYFSYICN